MWNEQAVEKLKFVVVVVIVYYYLLVKIYV